MERETERENQHGQLQPLWGSSQAFSMENSNRAAAAAGSEKKWKIWVRQFDNVQAALELIKNAPALREKLGIERVARYRHYLSFSKYLSHFPAIFLSLEATAIFSLNYLSRVHANFHPLITHSGHRILSPIKDRELPARIRPESPEQPSSEGCQLHGAPSMQMPPVFSPSLSTYIFSIFSIEFLWQFTMDSTGIWHCSRNPGANTVFDGKQLPKSCPGDPLRGEAVWGGFPCPQICMFCL